MKTIMLCLIFGLCLVGTNDPVALAWDDDDCCERRPSVLENLLEMERSRKRNGRNALSERLDRRTNERRMRNAIDELVKVLEGGGKLDQLTVMQIARKNKLSPEQLTQLISMAKATAELDMMGGRLPAEKAYELPPDVREAIKGMSTTVP